MSGNIDMGKVIKQAQDQGFKYRMTEKSHHQFYAPDGETIVTHSGTSSDWRGDENFMADMKRAGYVHGLNQLGDALSAAGVKEKLANGGAKLSISQYIIDALARHPEGLDAASLKMIVMSARSDVAPNSVYSGVNTLINRKYVVKMSSGLYKLTDVDRSGFRTFIRDRAKEVRSKTNGATRPKSVEVGERTGDSMVDEDLQALDNALAALAHIEGVVRKNREVLVQLATLKKLLGGAS